MVETENNLPFNIDAKTALKGADTVTGWLPFKIGAVANVFASGLFGSLNKDEKLELFTDLYREQLAFAMQVPPEVVTKELLNEESNKEGFAKLPEWLQREIRGLDEKSEKTTKRNLLRLAGATAATGAVGGMIGGIPGFIIGAGAGMVGDTLAYNATKASEDVDMPEVSSMVIAIRQDIELQKQAGIKAPRVDPVLMQALTVAMNKKAAEKFESDDAYADIPSDDDFTRLENLVNDEMAARLESFQKGKQYVPNPTSQLAQCMNDFLYAKGGDDCVRGECNSPIAMQNMGLSVAEQIAPMIQSEQDLNNLLFMGVDGFIEQRMRMMQAQQIQQQQLLAAQAGLKGQGVAAAPLGANAALPAMPQQHGIVPPVR